MIFFDKCSQPKQHQLLMWFKLLMLDSKKLEFVEFGICTDTPYLGYSEPGHHEGWMVSGSENSFLLGLSFLANHGG
jgi:hypothetical protein